MEERKNGGKAVKYRTRLLVFSLVVASLVLASSCSALGILSGQPKDKWQQLVEQENEKIGLKPLKLEPYAKEVGGERSEEHTSELQSRENIVCRLLLEKKNIYNILL